MANEIIDLQEPLWEMQAKEPKNNYKLFFSYLKLEKRSLEYLAKESDCSLPNIKKICKKWQWVKRCQAYDVFMAKKHLDEMQKNHGRDLTIVRRVAMTPFYDIIKLIKANKFDLGTRKHRELFKIAMLAHKNVLGGIPLERLINGLATEKIDNKHTIHQEYKRIKRIVIVDKEQKANKLSTN